MNNELLQQFKLLSIDRQTMIWQGLMSTPAFTDFLIQAKKNIEKRYFDLPEPATFEHAELAANSAARRQFKSSAGVIDDLLAIDSFMRERSDKLDDL